MRSLEAMSIAQMETWLGGAGCSWPLLELWLACHWLVIECPLARTDIRRLLFTIPSLFRCCSLSCSALLRLLPFVLLCFTGPKLFPLVRHMQMTQGQFNLFNKYLCCSRRAFIIHPLTPPCSPLPVFVYSFGSLIKNCFDLLCFLCFCKHCAKFPD